MKVKQVLIIISVLTIASFIGYRFGLSQSGNSLKSVVEPGSMTTEASYIIFTDGSTVYARNGKTGEIQFSGTDASTVINNVLTNGLSPGRIWQEKVVLKGNFTLTSGIIVPSYTILEIQGKVERGFNGGYMIDTDSSVQNQFINIVGGFIDGKWDTYSGSGIHLQSCRWSKITDSTIYNHRTDAITLNATPGKENYNIWISKNQINSAGQYCLNLGISDIWIEDNYIECSVGEFAVYVNAGAVTLAHNHIMSEGLADCVYIVSDGMNNAIHGGEIENCRNGVTSLGSHTIIDGVLFHLNNRTAVYLPVGSESSTITGCSFYYNSRNITGYSDIILENTVNNTITGNVFSTPTKNTRSAIREVGTVDYNIISGNTIDTANYFNPVIEKVGSHTVVKDNTGYNLPQESVETASYIIYTDGITVYAKNGTTGAIDFSGTDASQIIQSALNNVANGIVLLKTQSTSPIVLSNKLIVGNGNRFLGMGWMSTVLRPPANDYAIQLRDNGSAVSDLMIDGSVGGSWTGYGGIEVVAGNRRANEDWKRIERVYIQNIGTAGVAGYGIAGFNINVIYLSDVTIRETLYDAVRLLSCTDVWMHNVHVGTPYTAGTYAFNFYATYGIWGDTIKIWQGGPGYGFKATHSGDDAAHYISITNMINEATIPFDFPWGTDSTVQFPNCLINGKKTVNDGSWSGTSPVYVVHGLTGTPASVQISVNAMQPSSTSWTANNTHITIYHNEVGSLSGSWSAEYKP